MTVQYNGILRALVAAIILAATQHTGRFLVGAPRDQTPHVCRHPSRRTIVPLFGRCSRIWWQNNYKRFYWAHSAASPVGILSAGGYYLLRPTIRFAAIDRRLDGTVDSRRPAPPMGRTLSPKT